MSSKTSYFAYDNVNWTLPFLFSKHMIYIAVLKELLGEEFASVKYVYGSPECLWAGGRPTLLEIKNIAIIEKMINYLKNINIVPVFNFTNTVLKEEDLNDGYCNELLSVIAQTNSQVIVADDMLHQYIKNNYPQVNQTASVITFILRDFKNYDEETELINKLIEEYDKVVLRVEYFRDNLSKLSDEINDLSKVVLLINSVCARNCPYAKEHYTSVSKFHKKELDYLSGMLDTEHYCPNVSKKHIKRNTLSSKEINQAIQIGIKNLKIQGRQYNFEEMFKMLSEYFFNPKMNQKDIRNKIDKISAHIIQNSVDLQTFQMMKGM